MKPIRLLLLALLASSALAVYAGGAAQEDLKPTAAQPVRTDLYGDPLPEGAIARLGKLRKPETKNASFDGHHDRVTCLAYSPDGSMLASGGEDGDVWLWNPTTGKALRKLTTDVNRKEREEQRRPRVTSVQFSPDGKTLATASTDSLARLWDVQTGRELLTLRGHDHHHLTGVAFSPTGKTLASSAYDGTVRLWECASGKPLRVLGPVIGDRGMRAALHCVGFTQDGKLVAAGGPFWAIVFWETETGQPAGTIRIAGRNVTALAFAPESDTLAVAIESGGIQLLDLREWKAYLRVDRRGSGGLAWLPNGKHFTELAGETLCFRDLNYGRIKAQVRIESGLSCIAIRPDGEVMATAGADSTIVIREVPNSVRGEN